MGTQQRAPPPITPMPLSSAHKAQRVNDEPGFALFCPFFLGNELKEMPLLSQSGRVIL